MQADLVIVQLKNHDVILAVDWLGKYKVTLDCHRGHLRFERDERMLEFQGIRPTSGSLVV